LARFDSVDVEAAGYDAREAGAALVEVGEFGVSGRGSGSCGGAGQRRQRVLVACAPLELNWIVEASGRWAGTHRYTPRLLRSWCSRVQGSDFRRRFERV